MFEVKKQKNKIWFPLFLISYMFIFLYYPPFISVSMHYFCAVIAYAYVAFHFNAYFVFLKRKRILLCVILILSILIYLIMIASINHMPVKPLVFGPVFWLVIYMPICFMILHSIRRRGYGIKELILMIAACCNLQGVFAIISFVYNPFHVWLLNRYIAYGYNKQTYTSLAYYRLYGLAFHLTNFAPLIAACITPVIVKYGMKQRKYLLLIPLMVISVLLNSRTALLIMLLGIAVLFVYPSGFKSIKMKQVLQIVAVGIVLLILGIVLIRVVVSMKETSNSWFAGWIIAGFESIIGLFKGENKGYFEYTSRSSTWVMPKGMALIFGAGMEAIGEHAGLNGTDVGYINYLWIGGILYCIMLFVLIWLLIKPISRKKTNRWYFCFLVIAILCLNVKDVVFVQNEFMCFMFLLCLGVEYLHFKNKSFDLPFTGKHRILLQVKKD